METLVPIGLRGQLLKQKPLRGSETTGGQREGEVLPACQKILRGVTSKECSSQ